MKPPTFLQKMVFLITRLPLARGKKKNRRITTYKLLPVFVVFAVSLNIGSVAYYKTKKYTYNITGPQFVFASLVPYIHPAPQGKGENSSPVFFPETSRIRYKNTTKPIKEQSYKHYLARAESKSTLHAYLPGAACGPNLWKIL